MASTPRSDWPGLRPLVRTQDGHHFGPSRGTAVVTGSAHFPQRHVGVGVFFIGGLEARVR